MQKWEARSRSYVEKQIISFLENQSTPQSLESIIQYLRDSGVTMDDQNIQKIIGFLESDQKLLIVKSKSEKYKLKINPKWEEVVARRERVEARRYYQRGMVL